MLFIICLVTLIDGGAIFLQISSVVQNFITIGSSVAFYFDKVDTGLSAFQQYSGGQGKSPSIMNIKVKFLGRL
ncbi:MAG: hypothetical protein ACI9NY_001135 [Kiritimatiellia bacterium]